MDRLKWDPPTCVGKLERVSNSNFALVKNYLARSARSNHADVSELCVCVCFGRLLQTFWPVGRQGALLFLKQNRRPDTDGKTTTHISNAGIWGPGPILQAPRALRTRKAPLGLD